MARALVFAAIAASSATATLGCDDLSAYSTGPGEAYCGAITLAGAFRTGFSPRVQMRLQIDASLIDGSGSPGKLSTYEAPDGDRPERRLFKDADLRVIAPMAHDTLSQLSFGEGRRRNAIYAVSPADPEVESMLAIVSFRTDETVEVRLLRAGSAPSEQGVAPEEGRRTVFGIFPLARQQGLCGF